MKQSNQKCFNKLHEEERNLDFLIYLLSSECMCLLTSELHAGRLVEERSKKAKQRAKTAVVGDMEPLLSALPTINIPDLSITNSAGKR